MKRKHDSRRCLEGCPGQNIMVGSSLEDLVWRNLFGGAFELFERVGESER